MKVTITHLGTNLVEHYRMTIGKLYRLIQTPKQHELNNQLGEIFCRVYYHATESCKLISLKNLHKEYIVSDRISEMLFEEIPPGSTITLVTD